MGTTKGPCQNTRINGPTTWGAILAIWGPTIGQRQHTICFVARATIGGAHPPMGSLALPFKFSSGEVMRHRFKGLDVQS